MERIIYWLKSDEKDYKKGLELYQSQPNFNINLLRNFERKETPANRQKLIYELKKMVKLPSVFEFKREVFNEPDSPQKTEIEPKASAVESIKKEESKTAPLFHQLPAELRPVLLEANNLFKENCFLKTELNDLPDEGEAEALDIMLKIDRNSKANRLAWNKIDFWLEHKQLPKELTVPASDLTMDQLIYKRSLLESALSRQRKRLEANQEKQAKACGSERNKLAIKIAKQEKEILKKEEELFNLKSDINDKK